MKPLIQVAQVRERATAQSYSRGESYYKNDAIFGTIRRGNELEGRCEGSADTAYYVHATLDEHGNIVETSCTCEYDWGGDCKHVVALLLAYAHEPETFEERAATEDVLRERTHGELIALIRQMVALYPDLQTLIDRPVPSRQPEGVPVDTAPFQRELRQALREFHPWNDDSLEATVLSIARVAADFADAGRWHDASAIYRTILEECLRKDEYPADDEGQYVWALSQVVDGVVECLAQDEIAGNPAERNMLIDCLVDAYVWDTNMGGVGLHTQTFPQALLRYLRPEDIPRTRQRVLMAQQRKLQSEFGRWGAEAFGRFLIQLDAVDSTDPEETLRRLREQGMYGLLFEKLVELGRTDEAITVVAQHLTAAHDRLMALPKLVAAGRRDEAVELARASIRDNFDDRLAHWLAEHYREQHDDNALFELWLHAMHTSPSTEHYAALKQSAKAVGAWATVRPEVLLELEKAKQFSVLTHIYLYDKEWDAAWDTLQRATQSSPTRGWGGWALYLDLDVALASQHARPHKAIPVFVKYARRQIDARNRGAYSKAAELLARVRELYRQLDDEDSWHQLISDIRAEFRRLPALQDELNQVGL